MDPVSLVLILGGIAGGLIAIGTVTKAAFRGLRALIKLLDQVEFISHEFKPNSGSSMKDQVNRLEENIHCVKEQVTEVKTLFDNHLAEHLTDREQAASDHQDVLDISSPSIKRTPSP